MSERIERAVATFEEGFNCAQAVLSAFSDGYRLRRHDALRVAGAFGGGMVHTGGTCGAVTGALMVLGLRYGKTEAKDDEARERCVARGRAFIEAFAARHGGCACRTLLGYDLYAPGQVEAAREAGVFKTVCPDLVRAAAEILEDLLAQDRPSRRRTRRRPKREETTGEAVPSEPPFPELDKEAVLALPIGNYEGPIHFIDFDAAAADACALLRREEILGFDTETKPSFERGGGSNPTALIQVASSAGVWLFSLPRIADRGPLAELLADGAVLKSGVAIGDDVKKLQEVLPFEPGGFVELATMARSVGFKASGLRNLAGNLLGFRISKGAKTSNWERWPLSGAQVRYAATDAWVSRELYLKLRELSGADGRPCPRPNAK